MSLVQTKPVLQAMQLRICTTVSIGSARKTFARYLRPNRCLKTLVHGPTTLGPESHQLTAIGEVVTAEMRLPEPAIVDDIRDCHQEILEGLLRDDVFLTILEGVNELVQDLSLRI